MERIANECRPAWLPVLALAVGPCLCGEAFAVDQAPHAAAWPVAGIVRAAALGDVTGDGTPDLVAAHGVGDLDGDGCDDLLLAIDERPSLLLSGVDCDPVPMADLVLTVGGVDGTIVARVRHHGGDATSIAPRLRLALRTGTWPFVLKPLPGGCVAGPASHLGPSIDCQLANLPPGSLVERIFGFAHKAPTGATLGVDARVLPDTRDPRPADNVASAEIALWSRQSGD